MTRRQQKKFKNELDLEPGQLFHVVTDRESNSANRNLLGMYARHQISGQPTDTAAEGDSTADNANQGRSSTTEVSEANQDPMNNITVDQTTAETTTTSSSVAPESAITPVPTPNSSTTKPPAKRKTTGTAASSKRPRPSTQTEASGASKYLVVPNVSLSSIAGVDQHVTELLNLIGMPLRYPGIYCHLGIHPPRGILLHGPPGTGKTMLAHALAGSLGVAFLKVDAPSIVSGMSGESEKKLREVFDEARECAPCIVFLDEIDAITPKRETAQREMERRIVAQLLTCMDDLSLDKTNGKPVVLIGATNRPDSLDPALRRAGRFDREISLGVPSEEARFSILTKLCEKLRLAPDVDLKAIAKMTPGYVGADLVALAAEAGVEAVRRGFESLQIQTSLSSEPAPPNKENTTENVESVEENMMEVDDSFEIASPEIPSQQEFPPQLTLEQIVNNFVARSQKPLSSEFLSSLSISSFDFDAALKKVQPSAKREGFATVPGVSWSDVGALQRVREELRMAVVEPIRHPDIFKRVGIEKPMGVLLYGPPGCGKTLLAKAVANESCCNFISVKGPELLNKYVGESERAIRQVFTRAQASQPCVIFFDELDALAPSRSNDSDSQHASRLVNTLLTEMDGLSNRKNVYIIAATNRPDMIDPAMLRPGRLDKALYVDLPNASERFDILKTLSRTTPLASDVKLEDVANDPKADGFSGADLAALVREAAVTALRRKLFSTEVLSNNSSNGLLQSQNFNANDEEQDLISVDKSCFNIALDRVTPSVSPKERRKFEMLRKRFGQGTMADDMVEKIEKEGEGATQ